MAVDPALIPDLQRLDLRGIADVHDGKVRVSFDELLRQAVADAQNRPGLRKARKVTLSVTVTPIADDEGDLVSVRVGFDQGISIPKRVAKEIDAVPGTNDLTLYTRSLSPNDARQMALGERHPRVVSDDSADDAHEAPSTGTEG